MRLRLLLRIPVVLLVAACSGGDSPTDPPIPVPSSITLSASSLSFVSLGEAQQLTATVVDQHGATIPGASMTWASSDGQVASVSSAGLVTALGNGSATITATSTGLSASALASVVQTAASIKLSPSSMSFVTLGETVRLTAAVTDAGGSTIPGASLKWASSDAQVASVSSAGLVTSAGNGSATEATFFP